MQGIGLGQTFGNYGWVPNKRGKSPVGLPVPNCATAEQKVVAKKACAAAVAAYAGGVKGLGDTNPFVGADPCWVAQLPTCANLHLFRPRIAEPQLKPVLPGDGYAELAPVDDEGWEMSGLMVGGLLLLLAAGGYATYRVVKK